MTQVSLVGYASAGAFLGLAYFDYYYTLIALIVLCKTVLISGTASQVSEPAVDAAGPPLVSRPAMARGWSAFKPSRSTGNTWDGHG
jgi:hypothetical protein